MSNNRKRGVSFGTIVMLVITALTLVLCARIIPLLAGEKTLSIDGAQQIVTAITNELKLPELTLSDIPIFQQARQQEAQGTPAPTLMEMETPPQATAIQPTATPAPTMRVIQITAAGLFHADAVINKTAYDKQSDSYDYSALLSHISETVKGDVAVCAFDNLIAPSLKLSDTVTRVESLEALKKAGFNVLMLGNEKAVDQGAEAFQSTAGAVQDASLTPVSAATNEAVMLELNGVNTAFLHYVDGITQKSKTNMKKAGYTAVKPIDTEQVAQDIAAARAKGAKVIVVSLCWGADNVSTVKKTQIKTAQAIADAGADIIIGSRSQVVSDIEMLTGTGADGKTHQTLVAYSLGALMTSKRDSGNVDSILLHITMSYDPLSDAVTFEDITYTPTYFWRYKQDGNYVYHLVPSNQEPPDLMSEEQRGVMEKSLGRITKLLDKSVAKQE